jgi:hypothetical protein
MKIFKNEGFSRGEGLQKSMKIIKMVYWSTKDVWRLLKLNSGRSQISATRHLSFSASQLLGISASQHLSFSVLVL